VLAHTGVPARAEAANRVPHRLGPELYLSRRQGRRRAEKRLATAVVHAIGGGIALGCGGSPRRVNGLCVWWVRTACLIFSAGVGVEGR